MASAFSLMWAAEAARKDISSGLAVAILALIAVLPEYAVDLYFAYTAGHRPSYSAFAAANMTGANRLLIGVGWPFVLGAFLLGRRGKGRAGVHLDEGRRVSVAFLAVAGLYAFVIPATRRLAWYDAVVMFGIFAVYLWRARQGGEEEEELAGVALEIAELPKARRRITVLALFAVAAAIVATAAEPFADSLVVAGRRLGIDDFLLVQWLAPLASEAAEFIVALMFACRGRGDDAIGIMLASKVNQWTLLVGSLWRWWALDGTIRAAIRPEARGAVGRPSRAMPRSRCSSTCRLPGLIVREAIGPGAGNVFAAFVGALTLVAWWMAPIVRHRRLMSRRGREATDQQPDGQPQADD